MLRLLQGEDLDAVSRELKVTAATLSQWREVFLANGMAGLKSRETDARDEKIAKLEKALVSSGMQYSPVVGRQISPPSH
ncbi:MAG: helix-turn-helix domain-containing protein [Gammaproteobacteria bacterium]|nr:helix-turn-helix domain-containing protein [Gammaproteobacteria bacterium]